MSLYFVQKFLYELNRSEQFQQSYLDNAQGAIAEFIDAAATLTLEETKALAEPDIGLLFHLGVNGQILMHFAALHQIEWADHLKLMAAGIDEHGPVREGVYAVTGYEGVAAHADSLGQGSTSKAATSQPSNDQTSTRKGVQ